MLTLLHTVPTTVTTHNTSNSNEIQAWRNIKKETIESLCISKIKEKNTQNLIISTKCCTQGGSRKYYLYTFWRKNIYIALSNLMVVVGSLDLTVELDYTSNKWYLNDFMSDHAWRWNNYLCGSKIPYASVCYCFSSCDSYGHLRLSVMCPHIRDRDKENWILDSNEFHCMHNNQHMLALLESLFMGTFIRSEDVGVHTLCLYFIRLGCWACLISLIWTFKLFLTIMILGLGFWTRSITLSICKRNCLKNIIALIY